MTISEQRRYSCALKDEKTYMANIIRAERKEHSVSAFDRERADFNASY
jgi:hypothetical protein